MDLILNPYYDGEVCLLCHGNGGDIKTNDNGEDILICIKCPLRKYIEEE